MRAALLMLATSACQIELDHAPTVDATPADQRGCIVDTSTLSCVTAANHSDFTWVQSVVLAPKCTFSACHDGTGCAHPETLPAAKVNFCSKGAAYMSLVGAKSALDTTRTLVVPSDVNSSFLEAMIGAIPLSQATPPLTAIPKDTSGNVVGEMPQDSGVMCCQKLDAITRWIQAGAAND